MNFLPPQHQKNKNDLYVLIEEDILNQSKIHVLGIFDYIEGTKEIQLKKNLFGGDHKKYKLIGPFNPQISNSFDIPRYPRPRPPPPIGGPPHGGPPNFGFNTNIDR